MALQKIMSKRGGFTGRGRERDSFEICSRSDKNKSPKANPSIEIFFDKKLLQKLRWVVGDRVEIQFDPAEKYGEVSRVTSGGVKLTGRDVIRNKGDALCKATIMREFKEKLFPDDARLAPIWRYELNPDGNGIRFFMK